MELTEKELKLIVGHLQKKILPYLIYIFGSYVQGKARKDSDLDIAFLSEQKHDSYRIFVTAQELAGLLGLDVDLIDLNQASTVFQMQVIRTGKVIYCSDENRRMLFHLLALKKYVKLNEERKCILERIKERGSIYGE
ncbi:type VII toxin-antitoxin system MntA family adenylyltransferase antitoxin [Zhaonella formicivorans]|jgi:predicted nucleotidyltransferase|uniref:type VII toxin-antitoxin system MntA family adenylyltransferase antitoxin n=1 Tax=Zhaonella formicivorans TaxID=2528593 RepID=UPI0010E9BE96|nr:nucleotidyltransferase domain-containing protein [Zhaonella formicivorans]